MRRLACLAALLPALTLALAGCGEKEDALEPTGSKRVELMLDYFPNADHAGIYAAQAAGYFEQAGLDVEIRQPPDPAAPIKQVAAGRVDLAISYEPEVLRARDLGVNVVSIGAIVQKPLTSIISLPEAKIRASGRPEGQDGGHRGDRLPVGLPANDPGRCGCPANSVKERNVGFAFSPALITGKIDAALGAFWNYEGTELRLRGKKPRIIRVEDAGVPTYNELVLVANEDALERDAYKIRAFIGAVVPGHSRPAGRSRRCHRRAPGGQPRPRSRVAAGCRGGDAATLLPTRGQAIRLAEPTRMGRFRSLAGRQPAAREPGRSAGLIQQRASPRIRAMRGLLVLTLALALAAAGCGGDEGAGAEGADELLKRGFSTDVDSGDIDVEMELKLEGQEGSDGTFRLELSGPFRSRGPTKMPDADLDFSASGQGINLEGGLVLLPENAWIEFGGETYEVGEELWSRAKESLSTGGGQETFADAGVKPLDWMKGAETGEGEEIAGTETTKVTGELDIPAMLADFNRMSPDSTAMPPGTLDQAEKAIGPVQFEAWIGEDDIWRRVSAQTSFTVPEGQRQGAGGIEGGQVSLDMTLQAPNEEVSIDSPGAGRPISELLRALGVPPEALLGPGFEVPEPG